MNDCVPLMWLNLVMLCVCMCALYKTEHKDKVYNGISPCYLVDSPRLCSAVVQMLAVWIWETGLFFFFFKMFIMTSLIIKILFEFMLYEVIFPALNVLSASHSTLFLFIM